MITPKMLKAALASCRLELRTTAKHKNDEEKARAALTDCLNRLLVASAK